jgi:hypothetical protein
MKRYRVTFRFHDCKAAEKNLRYQRYILLGFQQIPQVEFKIRPLPFSAPVFLDALNLKKIGLGQLWRLWKFAGNHLERRTVADYVGRYEITDFSTGITKKVAVDAGDGKSIRDPLAHSWSNVYFKNNFWPDMNYGAKVKPLINGDGLLSKKMIQNMVKMRHAEKSMDLYYWTRLWGAKQTTYSQAAHQNIVEYQIRLYEALSKVRCAKNLGIMLPDSGFHGPRRDAIVKRLKAAGVEYMSPRLSSKEFWNRMAASKIAFARPGDHLCVSFRICSFLGIGACIMYDGEPFPRWHKPLLKGVHYEHGGCRMGSDFSLPEDGRYEDLTENIQALLEDEGNMDHIRHEAARYFDRYANPAAVAQHILETV